MLITPSTNVLKKLDWAGKDWGGDSLDTVKMLYDDARATGFQF